MLPSLPCLSIQPNDNIQKSPPKHGIVVQLASTLPKPNLNKSQVRTRNLGTFSVRSRDGADHNDAGRGSDCIGDQQDSLINYLATINLGYSGLPESKHWVEIRSLDP